MARTSPAGKARLRVNRAEADAADTESRYTEADRNLMRRARAAANKLEPMGIKLPSGPDLQSIKNVAGTGGLRINSAEIEQIGKKLPKP
jgi:hypothetical protein